MLVTIHPATFGAGKLGFNLGLLADNPQEHAAQTLGTATLIGGMFFGGTLCLPFGQSIPLAALSFFQAIGGLTGLLRLTALDNVPGTADLLLEVVVRVIVPQSNIVARADFLIVPDPALAAVDLGPTNLTAVLVMAYLVRRNLVLAVELVGFRADVNARLPVDALPTPAPDWLYMPSTLSSKY